MSNHHDDVVADAIRALSEDGHSPRDALAHVPTAPGLYAVRAPAKVWEELGLTGDPHIPLYVGKAEDSLVARDLKTHFTTGRTGSSTLRRSFAALLGDSLSLTAVPRNPANPGHFSNFGLELEGDERLTEWMRSHLRLAVWAKPRALNLSLSAVETGVLAHWQPPLNLSKVRHPLPRLKAARKRMATQARTGSDIDGRG